MKIIARKIISVLASLVDNHHNFAKKNKSVTHLNRMFISNNIRKNSGVNWPNLFFLCCKIFYYSPCSNDFVWVLEEYF